MHTPTHTKVKGDLLLELRDVNLEINKVKSELEIAKRERDAFLKSNLSSFKDLRDREEACNRIEEKFNTVGGDIELYVKQLEDRSVELRNDIKELEAKNFKMDVLFEKKEKDCKYKIVLLDVEIKGKKENSEAISKETEKKSKKIIELNKIIRQLKESNDVEQERKNTIAASLSRKELELSQREIDTERTRSELRVWSVRLHNKYGKKMSEVEKRIIPKI